MIRLVFGHDDLVAQWVSERIGALISKPYVAIGATRDGEKLLCGWVFNNWNGHNIEIHWASERPLTRGLIRAINYYVFDQVKAGRATARTRRSNKTMRKILPRLGFKFEGVSPRWYGPQRKDDAFCFGLMKEQARLF